MNVAEHERLRRLQRRLGMPYLEVIAGLVERQVDEQPELREWYETMTDEQSRLHEGEVNAVEMPHHRAALRYFHAWRIREVRARLGDRLADAELLDVGDTDGLMLKHLGKTRLGFNISPVAVDNIRSNGVDAQLGDGHGLPFDDESFDAVMCFETLEHVENQAQVLEELARVCRPDGRVFISIPWVSRTHIHARDQSLPRGYQHITELGRADFGAVVSHTSLEIAGEAVCDVLGTPRTPAEHVVALHARSGDVVLGLFKRFQFFELCKRPA